MKRINWKKGMRLTEELLRKSDDCTIDFVTNSFLIASAGQFGLLPSSEPNPFELQLDINRSYVDIYSLRCFGITKGGYLIDIDSDATATIRVEFHEEHESNELILIVQVIPGQWKPTGDGMEEMQYAFSIMPSNMLFSMDKILPIARLVKEGEGWRQDENFVPPLLFVSAHPRMMELREQFLKILRSTDQQARQKLNSEGRKIVGAIWPTVQQLLITIDKESEQMSPKQLLANVQKYVSAFVCTTEIDENLDLTDADIYSNYVYTPYSYENAYLKIKEGIQLCYEIEQKIERFEKMEYKREPSRQESVEAPYISKENLVVDCKTIQTMIPIENADSDAVVYFSIKKGKREQAQFHNGSYYIKFQNGFSSTGKESDKKMKISLWASKNGIESEINIFEVTLRKSTDFKKIIWDGYRI